MLSAKEARALLNGIDVSTLAGLRDRALRGVLVYSFARVSAAVSLRVADFYTQGPRSLFRLHEKGGRYNVVPAHHTAQAYVDASSPPGSAWTAAGRSSAVASPGGAMRSRSGRCHASARS